MSKKYIIEIEDEPLVRQSALHGEDAVFRAKGFKSLVFDINGMQKLLPYEIAKTDEIADAYNRGYRDAEQNATKMKKKQGMDEAWEFISDIVSMPFSERDECFGTSSIELILATMFYSEAAAKYETWKKKNEIKVGDEVKGNYGKWVVTHKDGDYCVGIDKNGNGQFDIVSKLNKTGYHFPEATELLKKMGETDKR